MTGVLMRLNSVLYQVKLSVVMGSYKEEDTSG